MDQAGGDTDNIDAVLRKLESQAARQIAKAALRCAIGGTSRTGNGFMHRGDVDDLATAAGGPPLTDEFPATEERTVQIGLDDIVPFFGGCLRNAGTSRAYPRVVD